MIGLAGLLYPSLPAGRQAWAARKDLPVFTPVGSREVVFGEKMSFNVVAKDPTNQPVFYEAANLPTGAALQPRTGHFYWVPTISQLGTYRVTFAAWDRLDQQRMANETVLTRVVYRKIYNSKGWGFGAGQQKVIFETTNQQDLYPVLAALELGGRAVDPTAGKITISGATKGRAVITSEYNIDPKRVTVALDGDKLPRAKLNNLKFYGPDKKVISLAVDFDLPALLPGYYQLQVKAGNELGITQRSFELLVRAK